MSDKPERCDGPACTELPEMMDDFAYEPLQTFTGDMGCFGRFSDSAVMCRKRCALRLRCLIERDQQVQSEIMEDLMSMGMMSTRLQ